MNLNEATDADLKAEIKRREDAKAAEARAKLDAHHALILEHIDVLLLFRPDHYGRDCSDTHHDNWRDCGRCLLLDIKDDQVVYPPDTEVELEIMRGHTGFGP